MNTNIIMDLISTPSPSESLSGSVGVVAAIAAAVVVAVAAAVVIRTVNNAKKSGKDE